MVEREDALESRRKMEAAKYSDTLSSIYYNIINELKDAVSENDFRIVVFVDDLDRCLPEKAVELLESIKLFLDIEGYLFIIGVAKDVVARGINYRYRHLEAGSNSDGKEPVISPEDYLEKMIQLPIELPLIEPGKKRGYIESLIGETSGYKEHAELIELGVGDNPRALKRFVNLLAFTTRHADNIKHSIMDDKNESEKHKTDIQIYFNPVLYIKWAIIVFGYQLIYNRIKGYRELLIKLQNSAKKASSEKTAGDKEEMDIPSGLIKVLSYGDLQAKEMFFPNNKWIIDMFVYLARATEIVRKDKRAAEGIGRHYNPGDMRPIPKGEFLYGDDKKKLTIDYDYEIDVFPVTNAQYREFIIKGGHRIPFAEENWAKPYNWIENDKLFPEGKADHPVVLVSHEDADTYCKWLADEKSDGYHYRLPTEEEWEKAARGEDGRRYPWGDVFDKERCNTEESGHKGTTEVTTYPDGSSPYDVHDMVGNVWEWTSSDYGKKVKVLRGGSWYFNQNFARCAYRYWFDPDYRAAYIGFRCVRTKK